MTDTKQPQRWQKRIERLEWRPDPGIVGTAFKQVERLRPKAMLQVGLGIFDLPEWLIDTILAEIERLKQSDEHHNQLATDYFKNWQDAVADRDEAVRLLRLLNIGHRSRHDPEIEGFLTYHDLPELKPQNAKLADALADRDALASDVEFLLSFVPAWAKDVPDGLGPTFYGTLSADGDREVKARVDAIRAALRKHRGKTNE